MARKHVYRIDDRVRVVNPQWFKRCGYPLVWMDLVQEVEDDPRTAEAMKTLGIHVEWRGAISSIPFYFLQAVAKLRVAERKFGGNERKIYHEAWVKPLFATADTPLTPGYGKGVGQVLRVVGKKVVKTGVRWRFCNHEDGDEGGLDDMKTHIILQTEFGWIEAANVEPYLA